MRETETSLISQKFRRQLLIKRLRLREELTERSLKIKKCLSLYRISLR